MISRERLEKLIEKNTPIYGIDYGRYLEPNIVKIPVKNLRHCPSNDNYQYLSSKDGDCYLYEFFNEDLCETKEDAEFVKEFKNIKRTEILNLPTWKEFKKDESFRFSDEDGFVWDFYIYSRGLIVLLNGNSIYYFDNSKEGYVEGCKMVKKLFLGDKMYD